MNPASHSYAHHHRVHLPIMTGFGFSHQPLVNMFGSGITSFFRKIEVYGSENVPEEGPIIL